MSGVLYLCATPIGNLEDITYRAVRILKEADLIAAEDTRNSIKLLNRYGISTPMTSYHEHNKFDKGKKLTEKLLAGLNIALITDAGTPGISDPGEELVKMCFDMGITVTAVPGAAACVTALSISGLPTGRFAFEAFLPKDKKKLKNVLDELEKEFRTIVMYEAPHRICRTLHILKDVLGEDRRISVCRELTKIHETVFSADLEEACDYFDAHEPKGEFVLVIEGKSREKAAQKEREKWESLSVEEHMEYYMSAGFDRKEAIKRAAYDRGTPKREIYNCLINTKRSKEK